MLSVAVGIWMGNAAAVLCGHWRAVTQRAKEVGCSRTAIYKQAHRVEHAVANEQAGRASYKGLAPSAAAGPSHPPA